MAQRWILARLRDQTFFELGPLNQAIRVLLDELNDRPLVTRILESRQHPEQGYRACLGIMQLGRRHGSGRLEAASARALALGSPRFLTVRNILASGQDRLPFEPPAETHPTPVHTNIRGGAYYAAATREED